MAKLKPGEIGRENVDRIQRDKDEKSPDTLHFWSVNQRLQGPIGRVFRAAENLKGLDITLPQDPGGMRSLPAGSYVMLVGSDKETPKSTPDKPSYYSDIFLVSIGGKEFEIDGGLEAVRGKTSGSVSYTAVTATPAPAGPRIDEHRLFEISFFVLKQQYLDSVPGMSADVISKILLAADTPDILHFWLWVSSRDDGLDILTPFPTGYEVDEFKTDHLSALDGIDNETVRRKLIILCMRTYASSLPENGHALSLAIMRDEGNKYAVKYGVTL